PPARVAVSSVSPSAAAEAKRSGGFVADRTRGRRVDQSADARSDPPMPVGGSPPGRPVGAGGAPALLGRQASCAHGWGLGDPTRGRSADSPAVVGKRSSADAELVGAADSP